MFSKEDIARLVSSKRILVLGGPGSGKSTLAKNIGEFLGLSIFHLDKYFWEPGWKMKDREKFAEEVESISLGSEWIIDGVYGRTLAPRLERADFIVMLELSRYVRTFRILRRSILTMMGVHERYDITEGCQEKLFDYEFVKFSWNYDTTHIRRVKEMIEDYGFGNDRLLWIRNTSQAKRLSEHFKK